MKHKKTFTVSLLILVLIVGFAGTASALTISAIDGRWTGATGIGVGTVTTVDGVPSGGYVMLSHHYCCLSLLPNWCAKLLAFNV